LFARFYLLRAGRPILFGPALDQTIEGIAEHRLRRRAALASEPQKGHGNER
jgi:hypothetical protein